MKESIKSVRNFILVTALGLLSIHSQAQKATNTNFSEASFVAAYQQKSILEKGGTVVISQYQEGAAIIQTENKFGLINQQGYEICAPIYDAVRLFNHGYAAVQKSGKWTFVNKQGKKLTPFRYDWVGGFENGLVAVQSNGKWGLLNEQGFEVVPTEYHAVKVDQEGKIWVQQTRTWTEFGSKNKINDTIAIQ